MLNTQEILYLTKHTKNCQSVRFSNTNRNIGVFSIEVNQVQLKINLEWYAEIGLHRESLISYSNIIIRNYVYATTS